tara:strand:+ start:61 stop:642 length:582 start_codon:yes stop_codon:yes gene_type:complete
MKKIKTKKSIYNFANFLSISRILATIPLIICFENMNNFDFKYYEYSIVIIFYIILSDVLDGFFARLSNCVTDFGRIIDPVADKACFLVVLTYMIDKNYYPAYYINPFLLFYVLLCFRDVSLILSSIYNVIYKKHVSQANGSGKLFIFFSSIMVISQIYELNFIVSAIFYILSLITMFLSTFRYFTEYKKIRNS